ncbi:hypothetical protein QBC46DRAFT_429257 [Diplogelasinospora grovesii]|uniref:HNH nuclease domain-containing protein n=1 Tax=Diplogelasinospora grovesii TaxID=303347 RepID=A0AAN6S647_9PEZI|nr:hypothetical protein QBC46DRAFT_429257 [Diplogelasinospora grovesii]
MNTHQRAPKGMDSSSLEGVIEFSSEAPLDADERAQAKGKLYNIIDHFEAVNTSGSGNKSNPYNRPKLVRLTYEYVRSEESQDIFLRAFFQAIALSMDGEDDVDFSSNELEEEVGSALFRFADYLFDNFFLPRRTGVSFLLLSSSLPSTGGGVQDFARTPGRMAELRGDCLVRDRHRCVISRRFDQDEAIRRLTRNSDEAKDDDGNLLGEQTQFDLLKVAHILPHALIKMESHPSKKVVVDILNMFDNGVTHLIEGNDIDRPLNAITLNSTLHRLFGAFLVFLQPVSDAEPHNYRVDSFFPPLIMRALLPDTRTLYLTENWTIDPPSPRLLAIHCAIAHILHLSEAGAYIDKLLDDMEMGNIRADGSIGRLVTLGLDGY